MIVIPKGLRELNIIIIVLSKIYLIMRHLGTADFNGLIESWRLIERIYHCIGNKVNHLKRSKFRRSEEFKYNCNVFS